MGGFFEKSETSLFRGSSWLPFRRAGKQKCPDVGRSRLDGWTGLPFRTQKLVFPAYSLLPLLRISFGFFINVWLKAIVELTKIFIYFFTENRGNLQIVSSPPLHPSTLGANYARSQLGSALVFLSPPPFSKTKTDVNKSNLALSPFPVHPTCALTNAKYLPIVLKHVRYL